MSRKTDFEHYITKATSLKEIRAKGQGEEERVVRAGIVQAAYKGNAVALTALFPLITCKDEFLDEVLSIAFNGPHVMQLLEAIPKNTARPLSQSQWLRKHQTTANDSIWSEMIRIFDLNQQELQGAGMHAARLDCHNTVAQVLQKNKRLGVDILTDAWTHCSEKMVDQLIPTVLNLERASENLKRSFQFYGGALRFLDHHTYVQSSIENAIAQRQKKLLTQCIDAPVNARKTRKM